MDLFKEFEKDIKVDDHIIIHREHGSFIVTEVHEDSVFVISNEGEEKEFPIGRINRIWGINGPRHNKKQTNI